MTERDLVGLDCEQPSLFSCLDGGMITSESVDELAVKGRWHYGQQLDCVLVSRRQSAEPAEHSIDHGRGDARVNGRSHQLADEVWVSVAEGENLLHVQRADADQCAYGWLRETSRTQAMYLLGV